ncbi:MAG: type II toxin-antitoxin system prevent-host-death family antitoxin [Deltaproteobacteria bacterium]|nr:type II toxin-antitoxin system prevent-host-death family antitoxin [Deltaproteobacteria bacterium]
MTKVKIAKLKSQLSRYLRRVRAGEEIVVTDRDTPIARVIPFEKPHEELIIIPAKRPIKDWLKIKVRPAPEGTDSLKALLEDREDRLEKLFP